MIVDDVDDLDVRIRGRVSELVDAGVSQRHACRVLAVARSTYYRWVNDIHRRVQRPVASDGPTVAWGLRDEEIKRVETCIENGVAKGLSMSRIHYLSWQDGQYTASLRTFYRYAARMRAAGRLGAPVSRSFHGMVRSDRQHRPQVKVTRPGQAICWDITSFPGPVVRCRFAVHVFSDLYSRKVVGVAVRPTESAEAAVEVLRGVFRDAEYEVVHSDNGSPMRSVAVRRLCEANGVRLSFSRPQTSNDNAYAESLFKTMKHTCWEHHSLPEYFENSAEVRAWVDAWVEIYNHRHHHRGLGFYTPASVHDGSWKAERDRKQAVLDAHYRAHPLRYRKPPVASAPAAVVTLNMTEERCDPDKPIEFNCR